MGMPLNQSGPPGFCETYKVFDFNAQGARRGCQLGKGAALLGLNPPLPFVVASVELPRSVLQHPGRGQCRPARLCLRADVPGQCARCAR